jgi:hypothetical protein
MECLKAMAVSYQRKEITSKGTLTTYSQKGRESVVLEGTIRWWRVTSLRGSGKAGS